jgi:Domain of unknown function (DUF4833)
VAGNPPLGRSAAIDLTAEAQVVAAAAGEVPLFTVSKSENKNIVQYSLRVDRQCTPIALSPVFAFWRMLEEGPNRTEALLAREVKAYGITSQVVTEQRADGGKVRLVLNAVPKRTIAIETNRMPDGKCVARSMVPVDGTPAYLYNVYIRLKWLFGVDYLQLSAWSIDGSHVVTEKLRD